MASISFNKLMRTKLNLSSKILSKNTTEIVNTCIEKLYKQIPMTYKNNLQQVKIVATKSKNHDAVEILKMQERQRQQSITIKPIVKPITPLTVNRTNTLNDLMVRVRKQRPTAYKKLHKTPPTYKIYSSRRFGSSASSSSGNLLHRCDDKYRSTRCYHTLKYFQKPISEAKDVLPKTAGIHHNAVSILIPARNQHMSSNLGSLQQAMEVSSNIQRDLMIINNLFKNRASMPVKTKVNVSKEKVEPQLTKIWNYFPPVLKPRYEQSLAKKELHQQYKSLYHLNHAQQLENIKTMEKEQLTHNLLPVVSKKNRTRMLGTGIVGPNINPESCSTVEKKQLSRNISPVVRQKNRIRVLATVGPNIKPESCKQINVLKKKPKAPPLQIVADKENQIKSHLKHTSCSSSDQSQNKLHNVIFKQNPSLLPTQEYKRLKPYKINGKIAPSATYCMAKLTIPVNRTKY